MNRIKKILPVITLVLAVIMGSIIMPVSASAKEIETAEIKNECGIRHTVITKYFTEYDGDGNPTGNTVRAGEGCGFGIYDADANLIATAFTDKNGSFDLADVPEAREYFGFDDNNLHPTDSDSKTLYIVDAESLEDPEAVSVVNINDEGAYSGSDSKDVIKKATLTVDGKEVKCLSYSFTNFYHINLGGWRIGNNVNSQFTIRGMGDAAIVQKNWNSEWGTPIGTDRCFPTSGRTYYYRYSCKDSLFTFEFGTDKDFEQSVKLSAELDDSALKYNYLLLWFRVPNGITVEGTANGGSFTCAGKEGTGYYDQAWYPTLFPVECGSFTASGTVKFNYDQDDLAQLINFNGNESMNFQFKCLYLPDCSADFLSVSDPDTVEDEEDFSPPDEDAVSPSTEDSANVRMLVILMSVTAAAIAFLTLISVRRYSL